MTVQTPGETHASFWSTAFHLETQLPFRSSRVRTLDSLGCLSENLLTRQTSQYSPRLTRLSSSHFSGHLHLDRSHETPFARDPRSLLSSHDDRFFRSSAERQSLYSLAFSPSRELIDEVVQIYGFKRVTTVSLLSILDSSSLPQTIHVPPSSTPSSSTNSPDLSTSSSSTTSTETFSASDYSAFHNAQFFRSTSGPNGTSCRLGALKPITKERPPRNRSKKAKAEAAEAKRKREIDEGEIFA